MGERSTTLRVVGGADAARKKRRRPERVAMVFRQRHDGCLEVLFNGVWMLVCSPLRVVAMIRNPDGHQWGSLVDLVDPEGRTHRIVLPARLMAGRGEAALDILLDRGLKLEPGTETRNALLQYLNGTMCGDGKPLPLALSASRTGWHGNVFVLPHRAIGGSELVVYQPTSVVVAAIRQKGTLEHWQRDVAVPAIGNSRLVASLCAAFASPLLGPIDYAEGFGLHWRGSSSTGKTTALEVAGSVWGGGGLRGYRQSWEATANGIESMAVAHCDLLLCIDELGQCRPEDVARVVYQLAAGTGRQRAFRDGQGAPRLDWRVIYLSTGEISLADKLRQARVPLRPMAGQAVRFIELPADAGAGFGLFETVPAMEGRPSHAERAGTRVRRQPGGGGAQHLRHRRPRLYRAACGRPRQRPCPGPAVAGDGGVRNGAAWGRRPSAARRPASGAHRRRRRGGDGVRHPAVADRRGDAGRRAVLCRLAAHARHYRLGRGRGCRDAPACHHRARWGIPLSADPLERSRPQPDRLEGSRPQPDRLDRSLHNRIGFIKGGDENAMYFIPPESWKSLMAGRDPDRAARVLREKGILQPGEDGRLQRKERVPGSSHPRRVYAICHVALFRETGDEEGGPDA